MKFNIAAKKLNEVDVNITFELTPEELIGTMKQSSEDFKTIIMYRDEIQELFKGLLDTYSESLLKKETKLEGQFKELNKIDTAVVENGFSDRYWYDINGEKKLKRSFE